MTHMNDRYGDVWIKRLNDLFRGSADSPYDFKWSINGDIAVGKRGRGSRAETLIWDKDIMDWKMSAVDRTPIKPIK